MYSKPTARLESPGSSESTGQQLTADRTSKVVVERASATRHFVTGPIGKPKRRWSTRSILTFALLVVGLLAFATTRFRGHPAWTRAGGIWEPPIDAALVYLSEMTPIRKRHWPWTPPPFRQIAKLFGAEDGDVVVVGYRQSPHGLFMHPPVPPHSHEAASLSYALDREYSRFHAIVGLNDGPPPCNGVITFSVYGDGELLWEGVQADRRQEPQSLDVSTENVRVLTLEVAVDGSHKHAHAVWIEPCLIRKNPNHGETQ